MTRRKRNEKKNVMGSMFYDGIIAGGMWQFDQCRSGNTAEYTGANGGAVTQQQNEDYHVEGSTVYVDKSCYLPDVKADNATEMVIAMGLS